MFPTPHIIPNLWFDTQASEAVSLYTSLFSNSNITSQTVLHDTPSGDCEILSFDLAGIPFMAISGGPFFRINPSVSLMVSCETHEEVDRLWGALIEGGTALMDLGEYPFCARYGWVQDRFGLSWQLMFHDGEPLQKITPSLLFVGEQAGHAEQAMNMYMEIFPESKMFPGHREIYTEEDAGPDLPGTLKYARCHIGKTEFVFMDSAYTHDFSFNEAISFVVSCDTQSEIDWYWEKLSFVSEAEQCGWLKDRFGISWQIVPKQMQTWMSHGSPDQIDRLTKAFLPMKKFDIAELERVMGDV